MLLTFNVSILQASTKKNKQWIWWAFFLSGVVTILFFGALVLMLPFLFQHLSTLRWIAGIFFVVLVILIIWMFFVLSRPKDVNDTPPLSENMWIAYLITALIIFIVFSMYDIAHVLNKCVKEGSLECRPEVGATSIYIDLVNIMQKLFLLLSARK